MKKYLLHPGYILSRAGDQTHYITADKLAALYGVRMDECVTSFNAKGMDACHLINLYPDYTGTYSLPNKD